jgi:hypothetical protein
MQLEDIEDGDFDLLLDALQVMEKYERDGKIRELQPA